MTPADREHYATNGYAVLRGVVDPADLDALEGAFEHYAADHDFTDDYPVEGPMHSPEFAEWLTGLSSVQLAMLYERMKLSQNLKAFSELPELIKPVYDLLDCNVTPKAARFRMDQPHSTRHLAVWHQDHAYVGGSTDTVTAWVPLQDTPWEMGPLLVKPRSHKYGPLHHDLELNGRKTMRDLTTHEIRMCEMERGDVLLFHSLLLHSGQVNLSDRVRFSVQVRYEPL